MSTTTQDRTENLVDAATQAAQEAGAKTLARIESTQDRFTPDQIAILRQLGVEDATDGDLNLFFHVCRTTGLDPFRKQIYMIGRNTKVTEWVDNGEGSRRKVERYVTKYTIQTGIDGYRRNGREAAKMLGDELAFDGPYWCGENGQWTDVWVSKDAPLAAKYTIFRNGEPFTGIAHFDEFVQTNVTYEGSGQARRKVGEEPNSMWAKMPRNQIAKCAEALAWRRAYPDDFSGLILEDASLPTVIDQDGNVEDDKPKQQRQGGRGVGGLRDRARAAQKETIDAEVVDDPAAGTTEMPPEPESAQVDRDTPADSPADAPTTDLRKAARDQLNKAIFATFGDIGMSNDDKRADRLIVIRAIVDRDIDSSKELTDDELQKLRNGLISRKQAGTLEADVNDWLNLAAIKEADTAEAEGAQQK
jgi:phage recombination protein Bet